MEAYADHQRADQKDLQRGKYGRGVRWCDHMDAYFLSGKIMDPGFTGVPQAAFALTYPV